MCGLKFLLPSATAFESDRTGPVLGSARASLLPDSQLPIARIPASARARSLFPPSPQPVSPLPFFPLLLPVLSQVFSILIMILGFRVRLPKVAPSHRVVPSPVVRMSSQAISTVTLAL